MLVGTQISIAIMEDSLGTSQRPKSRSTYDPTTPLLAIYSTKVKWAHTVISAQLSKAMI